MAVLNVCPDRGLLTQFLFGRLAADDVPALEDHLARCPACAEWTRAFADIRPVDIGTQFPNDTEKGDIRPGSSPDEPTMPPREPEPEPDHTGTMPGSDTPFVYSCAYRRTFEFLSPALHPDELGRLEHYRVLKLLGSGGMGLVFLAEDVQLGREVALKVMLPEVARDERAGRRFLREARALASVRNDHVVTIHHVGEANGVPFLTMELLRGESLDDWADRQHPVGIRELCRVAREIALGLAAAHERGLIHRDIKPSNIWIDEQFDRVRILDFGLARSAEGPSIDRTTERGAIVGTPAYMAPERTEGLAVDARCDLFSLGCVLYRIATGKPAFGGPSLMAILRALAVHVPASVSQVRPDLPAEFGDLVSWLIQKDPDARPGSARLVADLVEEMSARHSPPPSGSSLGHVAIPALHALAALPPAPVPMSRTRYTILAALLWAGWLLLLVWGICKAMPSAPGG